MNETSDVALQYRTTSDEQLLQIAGEGGIVDTAAIELQAELQRRGLSNKMVEDYRSEQLRYQDGRRWKDPNVRDFYLFRTGFRVFGRASLSEEDQAKSVVVRTR